MAQDRDKLRPHTPPPEVRAQTAPPTADFASEDLTPVEGDPVTQIGKRAARADASSRAAFGAIGELRRELRAVNDRDVRDHNLMMSTSGKIEARVDEIGRDVADLRENMGEVRGTLHVLVNQLEADRKEREIERREAAERERMRVAVEVKEREAEIEVKKTTAITEIKVEETAKVTKLEDEADEKKTARKIKLKIVGAVVAILGVLGTLATQC